MIIIIIIINANDGDVIALYKRMPDSTWKKVQH